MFVTGDTAAAVTLRLISRQPAMSPTGFSDSPRDGSGWVAAFDNCGQNQTRLGGSEKHRIRWLFKEYGSSVRYRGHRCCRDVAADQPPARDVPDRLFGLPRDGSGCVAAFDNCGQNQTRLGGSEKHRIRWLFKEYGSSVRYRGHRCCRDVAADQPPARDVPDRLFGLA